MLNKNIILTFSLLAAISVFAQKTALQKTSPIKLIERVVKKGNEIVTGNLTIQGTASFQHITNL